MFFFRVGLQTVIQTVLALILFENVGFEGEVGRARRRRRCHRRRRNRHVIVRSQFEAGTVDGTERLSKATADGQWIVGRGQRVRRRG